ncbi:MAG TPA: hypothetical protein VMP67_10885 [Candidatus Limnocylindria bacterium]|nr:hypothetical protein [Candidatus Limnocylindria bacterium]
MSQIERGGQGAQRWPAELPETDNPEGSVGEELRDEERVSSEQNERLAKLPDHERDTERTDQPAPGEESGLPAANPLGAPNAAVGPDDE